ncbi:MAG: hypothetical protein O2887_19110 [Bacteroidetes bacterium]|nr:hypothetical protein [Bacteroidota bacterium]MDA1122563.1 hypothetical protein [Bacteroidota bacterium]
MKFFVVIWFLELLTVGIQSFGQEKNFVIENEKDCSSLSDIFISKQAALNEIESKEFRDSQNFRINRKKGVRAGNYYSCDHATGFLKLFLDEDTLIFIKVPKHVWDGLIQSNDPDGFVESEILNQYFEIE